MGAQSAFFGPSKYGILPEILNDKNSRDIAEAYLNCGHSTLEDAALEWAKRNGYIVSKNGGRSPVRWGGN